MGCQCSQANSIVPQQPHAIEENHLINVKLEDAHYKPKETQNSAQLILSKENQKPKEAVKIKQKENDKGALQKKTAFQAEIAAKTQRKFTETPMADCTNLETAVIGVNKDKTIANKVQKALNASTEYKIEKESLIGPSSKTIEIIEQQKKQPKEEGHRVNQTIEIQEFAAINVDKAAIQQKAQPGSKIKIKSVKQVKEGSQKSVKPHDNFTLQQWEKNGEDQKLSRTERLRRVDQMQIQREEVTSYLNSVWDYEKQVLNSIIDKLQVEQHKKFEQPLVVLQ